MRQHLNSIILIDDQETTNFYNEIIITQFDCTKKVVPFQEASKALLYLNGQKENNDSLPDLIFVDMHMPLMNGWEFVEEYRHLSESHDSKSIVIMLSTLFQPEDEMKIAAEAKISAFLKKPMAPEDLESVIETFFPEIL